MNGPQHQRLSGGRLHLHHGPIDIVLWADGPPQAVAQGYAAAIQRFGTVLTELVAELPLLRGAKGQAQGQIAQRMLRAVTPYHPGFITPMAAVAGAVAEEILFALVTPQITRAYVNNGGDIALHLTPGTALRCAVAAGGPLHTQIEIRAEDPVRGIATSGWGGRSFSFGIADAVTVLARTAAQADAAATLIANAIDLPEHPAITRRPAHTLQADSDLGARLVTTAVGPLSPPDRARALQAGLACAADYKAIDLIESAALFLQAERRILGPLCIKETELV